MDLIRRARRHVGAIAGTAVLVTGAVLAAAPASPAGAATVPSFTLNWQLDGDLRYGIGFDAEDANGSSPGGYESYYEWSVAGQSTSADNPQLPNPLRFSTPKVPNIGELRMEIYSFPTSGRTHYDPIAGDGGVVVRIPASGGGNLGHIEVPRLGQGSGRLSGRVLSRSAVPDGRLHYDLFQVTGYHSTSTGKELDAFASGPGANGSYTTGPLWSGQYLAFVTDTVTGNKATGMIDVNGDTTFDIDLDVPCFGINDCEFAGSVAPGAGSFHPVGPNRILDTRKGLGITASVQPGDGRNSDPNNFKREETRLNHEFAVTGVGGVPRTGVGAVLLNVTATGSPSGGLAKIFPKPANTAWYDDESSFPASNPNGPLLVWGPGEDIANQVLVPVGVGGRLRIENFSPGGVDVIADVVGWFDESQPGQTGAGLTAITPDRLLDTRNGVGGPRTPFATGESRDLPVAGRGSVPADAAAVVGTITGAVPAAITYLTVWPTGTPRTETSVLNVGAGDVRPNMVTVGVGGNHSWSIFNAAGPHDVLFDAVGFFRNGAGSKVTPVNAATLLDTQAGTGGPRQAFGQGESRTLQVTGRGGVPADATAVYLSVTSSFGTATSYLTVWNGGTRPETSNLNWWAGTARSNLVLVPLGPGGTVQLYNALGSVHLVADVVAYAR